jgi:imidazolonepropionase-like amidohydrolase
MRFAFVLAILLQAAVAQPSPAQTVVFEHVAVIPMDRDAVLQDQTVIVRDGRIAEVGPTAQVNAPAQAVKIDGRGKYLLPGMAEMHGHIPPPTAPAEFVSNVLFLYVANGITTVRGMLGHDNQLELRRKANSGEIVAPTLYLAGPSFNGNSIQSAEQAVQKVRQQKAEGWDLLKIHPGVKLGHYDAMARTAKEVKIPFAGHVPAEVGILHALESGQQTIDHLDGYIEHLKGETRPIPEEQLIDIARRTREAGAWVVPTMVLWDILLGLHEPAAVGAFPELRYMPRGQVAQWSKALETRRAGAHFNIEQVRRIAENRKRLLLALHREGVKVLFGTDSPQQFSVPGFSMHREAKFMVDTGMSPYEVLRSGTANVGEYYKGVDKLGLVAKGYRADLILLEANPLDDITNLARGSGVMVRGRWIPESEIQAKLSEIARSPGE